MTELLALALRARYAGGSSLSHDSLWSGDDHPFIEAADLLAELGDTLDAQLAGLLLELQTFDPELVALDPTTTPGPTRSTTGASMAPLTRRRAMSATCRERKRT